MRLPWGSSMGAGRWSRVVVLALAGVVGWGWSAGAAPRVLSSAVGAGVEGVEAAPRSVYVLLVGHPDGPADSGLPRLTKVESDVAMMWTFFGVLGPKRSFVHLGETSVARRLAGSGATVRPATFAALEASVDELVGLLEDDPAADVYVYYAGHGRSEQDEDGVRTELYVQPTGEHDGVLTGRALQDELLERLVDDRRTRVHLVVDACQSYFVLERRGGLELVKRVPKVAPPVDPTMVPRFQADLPQVGALLATNGDQLTYEDVEIGGVFSYAVRTAGIGTADLNRDGRVTYGELLVALPAILGERAGGGPPGMVPPGGDRDAVFIDYRGRDVAAVSFAPSIATRYVLMHQGWYRAYGALYPTASSPVVAWLPVDQDFHAVARPTWGPQERFDFVARSAAISELRVAPRGVARGRDDNPLVLEAPLRPSSRLVPVEPPRDWSLPAQSYAALGVSGVVGHSPLGENVGKSGDSVGAGVEMSLVGGVGRHQGSVRAGVGRSRYSVVDERGRALRVESDAVQLGVGYGFVFAEGQAAELSVGPFVRGWRSARGSGWWGRRRSRRRRGGTSWMRGELMGRFFVDRSRWALRVDARVGSRTQLGREGPGSDEVLDMVIEGALGLEYEFGVR
ncbi:MAG: caspase family protein [bacterium]